MESGAFHDQDDDEEENFDDVDDFEAKSDPLNAIDLKASWVAHGPYLTKSHSACVVFVMFFR